MSLFQPGPFRCLILLHQHQVKPVPLVLPPGHQPNLTRLLSPRLTGSLPACWCSLPDRPAAASPPVFLLSPLPLSPRALFAWFPDFPCGSTGLFSRGNASSSIKFVLHLHLRCCFVRGSFTFIPAQSPFLNFLKSSDFHLTTSEPKVKRSSTFNSRMSLGTQREPRGEGCPRLRPASLPAGGLLSFPQEAGCHGRPF